MNLIWVAPTVLPIFLIYENTVLSHDSGHDLTPDKYASRVGLGMTRPDRHAPR